uniref:Uncharacterized protein n=1 Tax=Arundo donax TaxID=35708 RepID=A0A0A8ZRZ7_ARUDO
MTHSHTLHKFLKKNYTEVQFMSSNFSKQHQQSKRRHLPLILYIISVFHALLQIDEAECGQHGGKSEGGLQCSAPWGRTVGWGLGRSPQHGVPGGVGEGRLQARCAPGGPQPP